MTWNWNCNHDTPFHHRLLHETMRGALRHCPRCGAHPIKHRFGWLEWGEPRESWKAQNAPPTPDAGAVADLRRVGTDWSKPRAIPWLPWNHPNYYVSSEREALQVCRTWGINPDLPGGFISETHRERAMAAGRRNTAQAVRALTPEQRVARQVARAHGR